MKVLLWLIFLLMFKGESRFVCGQTDCNVEWSFEEVRKMALLTPEEVKEFEKKMFDNSKDVKSVSILIMQF